MDVGIDTPGPVAFAPGFTRAPQANRFTGDYDDTTPPLGTADGLLNAEPAKGSRRAPIAQSGGCSPGFIGRT